MPDARRDAQKLLAEMTDPEWANVTNVCNLLPSVNVDHKYEARFCLAPPRCWLIARCAQVEDEDGIYENDVVLLTVTLNRLSADKIGELKLSEKSAISMEGGEDQDDDKLKVQRQRDCLFTRVAVCTG